MDKGRNFYLGEDGSRESQLLRMTVVVRSNL